MNQITKSALRITSITLAEFIEAGGELTNLETINRGEGEREIHVFEAEGRCGTFTSDNACVSWFDAPFASVVEGLRSGDVSELPEARGISEI